MKKSSKPNIFILEAGTENELSIAYLLSQVSLSLHINFNDLLSEWNTTPSKTPSTKEYGVTKLFSDYKKCNHKNTKATIYKNIVNQIKKDR
jgi:hypothetical protein